MAPRVRGPVTVDPDPTSGAPGPFHISCRVCGDNEDHADSQDALNAFHNEWRRHHDTIATEGTAHVF